MISKKPLFAWVVERHRGLQLLLLLLIIATIFFRVFPLEMQKRIVNSAIAFKRVNVLFLYCGLYLGAVVLAGLLKYAINLLQSYIGQKILLEMRTQLYAHILTLPLPFFRRTPPGTVIASLTSELSTIGDFLGGALAVPIINILTLLTFMAYLAHLNPLLAALSFAVYPIELLVLPLLQRRFNRLNQNRIDVTRSLSNLIGEAVSGIHEVHGNAGYSVEEHKFRRFAQTLFTIRYRMNAVKFFIKFFNNFFQSLGPFILFLVGGYLTIQGRFDLGALVAFLSAYEKLYDPWKELMDYYQDLQDSRVRYRQVMDYFDVRPEFELKPQEDREPYDLQGRIEVKDASYVVDGQMKILDQVSLDLQPGEQLALVGLSGSGKSTLAMVMGQLYSYTSGRVLVDGCELKSLTKFDTSHNIGYVAQYPFIFDGTIFDNLLYACESLRQSGSGRFRSLPDRETILKGIEAVGLTEDILRIGLNTVLDRETHQELARRLIGIREVFLRQWKSEMTDIVDFFDINHFQLTSSVGENITFGYPNRSEYEQKYLVQNALFLEFLQESGLLEPLILLGSQIAVQTVALLQGLQDDAFFFEMSPIPIEEFSLYSDLVERMELHPQTPLERRDEEALLRLALRFVPSRHKMVALSASVEDKIVGARRWFMEKIDREAPQAFTFYYTTDYLYSQSVLANILFGNPKGNHPKALEQIRGRVVNVLEEESLLDEVMELALQFQVGSKGDRLSGGQKQKIALARLLLKKPHIFILDEATASLDNSSQARLQHLFNSELRGKCTLISVVHRLEMVRDYDRIVVIKAGKIVEMGRYDDLIRRKGFFYELTQAA